LGQEKPVHIYKLIVEDSVEENILQLAGEKRQLNDVMLEEGSFMESATTRGNSKQIRRMFEAIFKKERS
jgi:helicase SWR1